MKDLNNETINFGYLYEVDLITFITDKNNKLISIQLNKAELITVVNAKELSEYPSIA